MPKKPYLTKSRFKLALECPTKLFYTGNPDYYNNNEENEFLVALAKGGYQVGELAKYKYCNDPIGENITINEQGLEAVEITKERLLNNNIVIAEGAFFYDNLFIRADIIVKNGNTLKLIEVKSKSYDSSNKFTTTQGGISSKWAPYINDIAFQTYVIQKSYPELIVQPHLLLINKDESAEIDGMNHWFSVKSKENSGFHVQTKDNLSRETMGSLNLLIEIPMAKEVQIVMNSGFNETYIPKEHQAFESFIKWAQTLYTSDIQYFTKPDKRCKKCTFKSPNDTNKCGFTECWTNYQWPGIGKIGETSLKNYPLSIELWNNRHKSGIQDVPFLELLKLDPPSQINDSGKMTVNERQLNQINCIIENKDYIFLKTEFKKAKEEWNWPYHMIDFETSTTALPFFKNVHPYQSIAFQFSHHIMYKDGKIEHYNDWLSFEENEYPNINFVRALKKSLKDTNGSIFRYHNHENTILRHLREDILIINPPDKEELIDFIDWITKGGDREMIDLAQVIREYYYSAHSHGNNSIKKILPAILNDCEELTNLYSKSGVYGKELPIKSRNFSNHTWLQKEFNFDPYKTLPPIADISDDLSENLLEEIQFLGDGSAAMLAYNMLQSNNYSRAEKETIKQALLNYCELDTFAMVIIMQGLMKLEEKLP